MTRSTNARSFPPSFRGNLLLRSLSADDVHLVWPSLSRVCLCPGEVIGANDAAAPRAYFPETLVVFFRDMMGHKRQPAIGIVGLEGMVGWQLLMGGGRSPLRAVAEMHAGTALSISGTCLLEACARSSTLGPALLRYAHNFMAQMACTIASTAFDAMERRVARWLLMLHDRTEGDALELTHDHVSSALHVRRASVTDCLHLLEGDLALRCTRGRIIIRDRYRLEQVAGTSYGSVEANYALDIGPFGKTAQPAMLRAALA